MPFAAERQFLVKIDGIDGYFATAEGGGASADVEREFDGGSRTPEVLTGPAIPKDLRIGRGFKPERDADVLARCARETGTWRTGISITPCDRDLVPAGRAQRATAVMVDYDPPRVNANSGSTARYEMTWAVETLR